MRKKYAEGSRKEGELRLSELMEKLGVCRRTIENWVYRGSIIPEGSLRKDQMGRYWFDSRRLPDVESALESRLASRPSNHLDETY